MTKGRANQITALTNEIDRLKKALEFYADRRRYDGPNQPLKEGQRNEYGDAGCPYLWSVERDNGAIARTALGK